MRTGKAERQEDRIRTENKRALMRNLAHERTRAAVYAYAYLARNVKCKEVLAYAEHRIKRLQQEEARYA